MLRWDCLIFLYGNKCVFLFIFLDIVVSFVGGVKKYVGWLEVYKFGKWGIVCDINLNDKLVVVVCRFFGFLWYEYL